MIINFYNNDKLNTTIIVDNKAHTFTFQNYTDVNLDRAFGCKEQATWEDYNNFLLERCFPPTRQDLKYCLNTIGLEEYDPIEILKKTKGTLTDDKRWVEIIDD